MTILNATFNVADRALDGYTSESGHVFSKHPALPTSNMAITGGEVYHNVNSANNKHIVNVPAVADGVVQAVVNVKAASNSQAFGLLQRYSATEDTGYVMGFTTGLAPVAYRYSVGTQNIISSIKSLAGAALALNSTNDVQYVIRGTEHRLYLNGLFVAVHEDNTITAPGVTGLYMSRAALSDATKGVTADSMTTDVATVVAGPVNASFTATDGTPLLTNYVSESGHRFIPLFHFGVSVPTISGGAVNKGISAVEGCLADHLNTVERPVVLTLEFGSTYSTAGFSVYTRAALSGSSSSTFTTYEATWTGSVFRVGKRLNGTFTDLPAGTGGAAGGTPPANTIGANKTLDVRFVVTNVDANNVEARIYLNDVQLGGASVDTSPLPLGYAGWSLGAGTAGPSTNNVRLANFSTGAAASASLTLDKFLDYEIKQRAGFTGSTLFPTGGDVPTNAASIRYRLINSDTAASVQANTTPGSLSVSAGRWSGTLSLPQPGLVRFNIVVEALDSGGTVLGTVTRNQIGVGEVFIDGPGDSTGIYRHHEQGSSDPLLANGNKFCSLYRRVSQTGPGPIYDPLPFRQDMRPTSSGVAINTDVVGNAGFAMANELTTRLGVPVMFCILSSGGATIDNWNSGQGITDLNTALLMVHNIRGLISGIGFNDATQALFTTRSQQAQRRRDLFAQWRGIIGTRGAGGSSTIPIWMIGSPSNQDKADPSPALGILNRQSELDVSLEANNTYIHSQSGIQGTDSIHLGSAENIQSGHVVGRAVAMTLLGQGPIQMRIIGATAISPTVTRFKLQLPAGATDITSRNSGTLRGVEIATDEAMTSPLAFVSATRFSATEFDVTHASAGTGARFYRYGNAANAGEITNGLGWVMDNQTYPQTLEPTRGSLSIRPLSVSVNGETIAAQLTTLP